MCFTVHRSPCLFLCILVSGIKIQNQYDHTSYICRWLEPWIEGPYHLRITLMSLLISSLSMSEKNQCFDNFHICWYNTMYNKRYKNIVLFFLGLFVFNENLIVYSQETHITFRCPMRFQNFPLDTSCASSRLEAMPMMTLRSSLVLLFFLTMILWEIQFLITTSSWNFEIIRLSFHLAIHRKLFSNWLWNGP